jgi:hypothetical protein
VLVDELADHLLEVLILRDDSGKELEASHVVGIDNGVGVSKSLSLRSDHDLSGGLSNERSRLNLLGREVLSATWLGRAVTSDHGLLSGTRRSVVVGESVGSLVLEVIVVVAVATHLSLNEEEDLLDELDGVRALEDLRVKGSSILLSHVHEVSLVLGVGLLLLADLWQFVVGHIESLAIDDLSLVEASTGSGSAVGLLEAHKGVVGGLAISGGDDLHRLNFTVHTEEVSEILVSVGLREALDEQVALLLGVLESLLLSGNLSLSLVLRDGGLHVDLEAIELLIMEVVDSIGSAGGTVSFIVGLVEADESEGLLSRFSLLRVSVLPLHHDAGLDCAKLAEDLLKLSLVPSRVEVLDIDVVVHLANLSVVLGLVLDNL